MKKAVFLGLISSLMLAAHSSLAAETENDATLENNLRKMEVRTQQLEHELQLMRAELALAKPKHKPKKHQAKKAAVPVVKTELTPAQAPLIKPPVKALESDHNHYVLIHFLGTPVVTSPYLGIRSEYDGSDLITNISAVNEDLRLLKQHGKMINSFKKLGAGYPNHPIVELSGRVEALGQVQSPYIGTTTGDATLNAAELQITPIINPWVFGFMNIKFDGSPANLGSRVSNSRFYLEKGFVTVGNLNQFPLYATAGQLYMPFGRFASHMLSAPLPQTMARTLTRGGIVGFQQPGEKGGFFGQFFGFRGDSVNGSGELGGNLGYNWSTDSFSGEVAFSAISNIADADGMQFTGAPGGPVTFTGFGFNNVSEMTRYRVPAIDVNGKINVGNFDLAVEYVQAVSRFDRNDLRFNGRGALPKALNVEGNYNFHVFNIPTSLALGYGFSDEAYGLYFPRQRIITALNMSWFRDTIQTIEYRYQYNYPNGTTGGGRNGAGVFAPNSPNFAGKSENLLTFQFGIYF